MIRVVTGVTSGYALLAISSLQQTVCQTGSIVYNV